MAADDQEYYGYYYDTEEDRGLLDPSWERQQRKVVSFNKLISYTISWHDCMIMIDLLFSFDGNCSLIFQGAKYPNNYLFLLFFYADVHSMV